MLFFIRWWETQFQRWKGKGQRGLWQEWVPVNEIIPFVQHIVGSSIRMRRSCLKHVSRRFRGEKEISHLVFFSSISRRIFRIRHKNIGSNSPPDHGLSSYFPLLFTCFLPAASLSCQIRSLMSLKWTESGFNLGIEDRINWISSLLHFEIPLSLYRIARVIYFIQNVGQKKTFAMFKLDYPWKRSEKVILSGSY